MSLVFGRFLSIAFPLLRLEPRCVQPQLESKYHLPNDAWKPVVEGRPFPCAVSDEATETTRDEWEQSEVAPSDLLYQFEHPMFLVNAVDLGPRALVIQGLVLEPKVELSFWWQWESKHRIFL
ncbi:hypothetical protein EV363DRAFT_1291894 [Boletus edulis]|nr:hypothetical protein EV363DRAFT_1291894 [Boletus edulis]